MDLMSMLKPADVEEKQEKPKKEAKPKAAKTDKKEAKVKEKKYKFPFGMFSVSYTHLTLPTKRIV